MCLVWSFPQPALSHCPSPKTRAGAGNYHICGLEQRQGAHSLTTTPEKQTSLGKTYLLPIPIEVGVRYKDTKNLCSQELPSQTQFPFTPNLSILHRIPSSPQWQKNEGVSPWQLLPPPHNFPMFQCRSCPDRSQRGSQLLYLFTSPCWAPVSVGLFLPFPSHLPGPKLLSQSPPAGLSPVGAAGLGLLAQHHPHGHHPAQEFRTSPPGPSTPTQPSTKQALLLCNSLRCL